MPSATTLAASSVAARASIRWTVVDPIGLAAPLLGVERFGDRFVGITDRDVVASDDGSEWQVVAEQPFGTHRPLRIARAGDHLAVFTVRPLPNSEGVTLSTWQSRDAKAWEQLVAAEPGAPFLDVGRVAGRWVAAAFPGPIYTSGTGRSWREVPDVRAFDHAWMAHAPDGLLIGVTEGVGGSPYFRARTYATNDGETWAVARIEPDLTATIEAVAWNAGRYVAVGIVRAKAGQAPPDSNYDAAAWWSHDGASWQRATFEQDRDMNLLLSGSAVAYRDGFMLVGHDGNSRDPLVWWSADGTSWQPVEHDMRAVDNVLDVVVDGDSVVVLADTHTGVAQLFFGELR
jgi:hypothetical protein